jgi:hypothetical protein
VPLIGPYYWFLVEGNPDVVSHENFRHLFQTLAEATSYIDETGVSAEYYAITLQQGAPVRTRNPLVTTRQRVTVGTAGRRRQTGRSWDQASPETRRRLIGWGRDQNASQRDVRRYYESGASLDAIRPSRAAVLNDPTRWLPYIRSHRAIVNRWTGTDQGQSALEAMATSQRSGMRGAAHGVYIRPGIGRG